MKKAGLLESPEKVHVKVTSEGQKVLTGNAKTVNVAFLKQFPEFQAFISPSKKEMKRSHAVASYLEQLVDAFVNADSTAGRELYMAFNATGDWDDAGGSHELGNQLCEALQPYWHGETAA